MEKHQPNIVQHITFYELSGQVLIGSILENLLEQTSSQPLTNYKHKNIFGSSTNL